MSVLKFFRPPGSTVESSDTVRLSDGTRMPAWAFIAVPISTTPTIKKTGSGSTKKAFVDIVNGALHSVKGTAGINGLSGGFKTAYDVSSYTRRINVDALRDVIVSAAGLLDSEAEDEVDPGYFEAVGSTPTAVTTFELVDYAGGDSHTLGDRDLKEYLVKRRVPQTLADTEYATRDAVVTALGHIALNVVDMIDEVGEVMPFIIDSGYVPVKYYSPDEESRYGRSVRIDFSSTTEKTYFKAVAMAKTLPFDSLFLDYGSTSAPLVTVLLTAGSQRRRIATRYDDRVVVEGKLVNLSKTVDMTSTVELTDDLSDVHYDDGDDYTQIVSMLMNNASMFGGMNVVNSILGSLGVNPNQVVPSMGSTVAQSAVSTAKDSMASAVECPEVTTDPKLFPTASNPALRRLSDLSQLDDSTTQDALPYALRANNPMKVKTVPGVTDLKTRFGYLGDSEGIAVYRDHVGGAAAGMNYVMQTSAGKTMAAATKDVASTSISREEVQIAKENSDVTTVTAPRLFSGMSQHLFGVADPTGVMQQCATIKPDSMETMVAYCAALSKVVAATPTSPLTHDEWASAYQIAKNQPNEHLKKSTTGADLPVTEEANTIDTGVMTPSQAKDSRNTIDYEKRAKNETWNPVTNYPQYANLWGANGSNWIAQGIVNYEQKTSNTDTTRVAKYYETEELNQDAKHPTDNVLLPWTVKTSA